jgi:integrase
MRKGTRPGLRKRGRYWHIEITHCGQTVRRSLETEDDSQAARLYDKIKNELWERKHLDKSPERYWEEAALLYVERCNKEMLAGTRKTLDAYRLKWLNARLKGTSLNRITLRFVKGLLQDSNSQRHYSAIVSAVLRVAEDEGWIVKPQVMIGGPSKPRARWLTPDEARQLLSRAGYLHDAVLFSLATGLRRANVMGLRWSWIKDRAIIIPEEAFKQGRVHMAPLNKTAMACIKRQIGRHEELVFTDNGRSLENPKSWESKWNVARQGIKNFRWHDLRHTWASYLIQNDVPEAVVETLGGWQSGKMVRRYAHASVESLRPYAEVLDRVLGKYPSVDAPQIAVVA